MDDLLTEFLTETNENLGMLDQELVKLEKNPNDKAMLSSIFRIVHTIKGTCGFLGLPRLEKVAHAGENILGKFRDGELPVTPEAVSLILESLDKIKNLLGVLEATQAEPEGNDQDLIDRLNAHAEGRSSAPAAAPAAPAAPVAAPVAAAPAAAPAAPIMAEAPPISIPLPEPDEHGFVPVPAYMMAPPANIAPANEVKTPAAEAAPAAADDHGANKDSVANQSIRVNVELLENLMTMVSELVLTRNQLLQILRSHKESEFASPLQRLNLITSELQEGVMKTRMQPIGNAWAKLPRIIRDLSHELGKKIELVMLGAETELDRQVLELIKDPLTHMVRNSADHGIEKPADRLQAGKNETGKVVLSAYHEGGHIIIEITDDGRGLPVKKIREKIVKQGMATEAEVAQMPDEVIFQYIFKAGLSTAQQVTSVSGRGVGMDVVKTNIERIGGTIELFSQEGKGSRFVIKIPLTLAIVSALIVESVGERFAIPQLSVVELVRVSQRSELKIENINNTPVLRLRNRLLPLVSLRKLLRLEEEGADNSQDTYIVVTQVGANTFGIMVDRVFDTEEIVVKPVAQVLRSISMFSGNTILGDGSVIMILDPNGISTAAGELRGNEAIKQAETKQIKAGVRTSADTMALLLFKAGNAAPKAVPLALVARLEDIDLATVEFSSGQPLVQYRGHLMPLVPFDNSMQLGKTGLQPVLVFADGERHMGLIVDEIVDIVEEKLAVEIGGERAGLMGSAIIAGKATDVIDAGHYLTQAYKDWFGTKQESAFEEEKTAQRILLIDDSPFFRNLLTPLLSVAGYNVTAVQDAKSALELADNGEQFDVIVSDIEMPVMNGFEFAAAVRQGGPWQQTPLIALSSHATPRDLDRGRAVGFTDYVAKFDRDSLLNTLEQIISTEGRRL